MERRSYTLRDGTLSALHFGDTSEPVRLVFLHANGFNAQSYRMLMEKLNAHAVVFDMRGHGLSRALPQPHNIGSWKIFRDDCVEFFDRHLPNLTDSPVVLSGHSFGAISSILCAPYLRGRLGGYVGFDPVTLPLVARLTSVFPGGRAYMRRRLPIARKAARRRSVFASPEAAFKHWQGRGAFRAMTDETLRDYIEGGLFQRDDGEWQLACDPKWEQTIFVSHWHNVFRAVRDLPDNSNLIYAGGPFPVSSTRSRRAIQSEQPKINVEFNDALGHLFPLSQPDVALQALQSAIDKAGA